MLPIVYVRKRCTCPPLLGPRRPRRYRDIRWYRETIAHRQLAHGRPREGEGEGEAKEERRLVRKRESGVGSSSSELYRVTLEWIRQRILVGGGLEGEGRREGEGKRRTKRRERDGE